MKEHSLLNEISKNYHTPQQDSNLFYDACIVLNDLTGIPVHKFILSVRSPVFKAMLNSGLSETTSNEIVIVDFEPSVVKLFVDYLYTDECHDEDMHTICELYKMADKYQAQGLLILCEHKITALLYTTNVIECLLFADLMNNTHIKNKAIELIVKNSNDVINSENSDFFERITGKLAMDVVKALARK
jgi:speckle-type POZ protein